MKHLLSFVFAIFFAAAVHAEPYGQITISSCYQQNVVIPVRGGTVKIIGGTTITMGSTNPLDFNSFDLVDLTTGIYWGMVYSGDPVWVSDGQVIQVTPRTNGGTINPGGWGNAILEIEDIDIAIPEACQQFNQLIHFGAPPFPGLCGWDMEMYDPHSGTSQVSSTGDFVLLENGFCTPPPGQDFIGMRCLTVSVTLRIYPCDLNCPVLSVTRTLPVCCNNCQPYNSGPGNGSIGNPRPGGELGETFSVYPNPATNIVTLEHPERARISVYSSDGRLVKTMDADGLISSLDVAEWTEGMYLVRVETENGMLPAQKLIVTSR